MNIRSGNFNPLPPHGGRRVYLDRRKTKWKFQSTPSAWRETRLVIIPFNARFTFQSTPSAWRETACCPAAFLHYRYFNPLPPHGGRQSPGRIDSQHDNISIHSLRMEGDVRRQFALLLSDISIHSLRMEGDFILDWKKSHLRNFNPLPPHGGRHWSGKALKVIKYFNPLPPHGGRQLTQHRFASHCVISIHSLRMEGDEQFRQFIDSGK